MRILFLSTWFPYPPDNGSKLRANYLIKALTERHEVSVVAFRPHLTEGASSASGTTGTQHPVIAVPDDPYRYVPVPQFVKYISPSPLIFRPSSVMREVLAGMAQSAPWDAVIAFEMPVAQYARSVQAAARILEVDTALSYQLYDRFQRQRQRLARASHWISWQKAHRYESEMLRHFQLATVVWQAEADLLQQMTKGSNCVVTVVPNGVDSVRNQVGLSKPNPNTLVYNGSLTYNANYDAMRWFLAEIYPLIKAEQPDVRLLITGSIKGVDVTGLSLDDSVTLTGFVDDVRVPVSEAALCVVPIRLGSGTRTKILEAMSLGTPVVSTTKGAEGLDFVDGEHLLLADTPPDFARSVLTLLANRALRTDLAARARRLVEHSYDWAQIGRRFATLVEQAVVDRQRLAGMKTGD